MRIGEALRRAFSGLVFKYEGVDMTINYHYGDHKELIKWVTLMNAEPSKRKYPLVWYVIAPYQEFNGEVEVRSRLIILAHTELSYMNDKRKVLTYDAIIEPVWKVIKKRLETVPHLSVLGTNFDKYDIKDEPNYGVDIDNVRLSQNDFSAKQKKGEESITIDIVDGRVISLHMRLKPECIT